MKRFLLFFGLAAWSIVAMGMLGPADVSATVRHLRISHAPAPSLRTIEIRSSAPQSGAAPSTPPATKSACATCPQTTQAGCVTCPPQSQSVQLDLVRVPLPL